MKTLVCAIFAAAVLVGTGVDGPSQASAASAAAHVKNGKWQSKSPGWGKPRPAWWGPRGWWGPGYWGGGFWWGPRPWRGPIWYGYPAYPYAYYPYAYPPSVVVQPNPPVYVQPAPADPQPAPSPQQPQYWYYCEESRTYYPYVKECPGGWMTVVPQSSSPSP